MRRTWNTGSTQKEAMLIFTDRKPEGDNTLIFATYQRTTSNTDNRQQDYYFKYLLSDVYADK